MRPLVYKFIGGVTAGSLAYYPFSNLNTEFYYQKTKFNQQVLNLCDMHLKKYVPSFYLYPHGAFQSLWYVYGSKKDKHIHVDYERDVLKLNDGGQVSIDWAYPDGIIKGDDGYGVDKKGESDMTKICFVFPGLSGSSRRGYVKSLVHHLTKEKGYIVGVFMHRGVDQEYTSPSFADLSSSDEIKQALTHTVQKFGHLPNPHFVGVGMSMGANLMMRVAGEMKDEFPLEAMVSFNNPFDIWLSINLMRNSVYEKYLARELRKNVVIRENMTEQEKELFRVISEKFKINFEELQHTESWHEFDEKLTVKVYKDRYKSAADYYWAASCLPKVKEIKKPTLVIHSRDDPIIPLDCLPIEECKQNPNIIVGIVKKGGHVQYFQGMNGQGRWYPLVSGEYLDAVIKIKDKSHLSVEEQAVIDDVAKNSKSLAF